MGVIASRLPAGWKCYAARLAMPTRHENLGPAAALTALTVIWGYNWIVMKLALVDAPALTFSALRSLLSAGALFVVLLMLRRPLRPARGGSLVLLGLLQTMGFVGFAALALKTGAAGKSAVLAYTMPFWTLLLAGPLLGEKMRRQQWPAVVLAAAGLFGIVSPWSASLDLTASLFSLGAAWSWAASNIVAKRMALEGSELLNVSAWQMVFGGCGLCVLAYALETEPVNWTGTFAVALAYNVVLATALAWLLWLFIHLMSLAEFQNRLLVLIQWGWNYVTRGRSARLITDEPGSQPDAPGETPTRA